jgi:hypothetical protein
MQTAPSTDTRADPRELLGLLKAADIRASLSQLAAEERALRVLLRAAVARESAAPRQEAARG